MPFDSRGQAEVRGTDQNTKYSSLFHILHTGDWPQLSRLGGLTKEHSMNYVLSMFMEGVMVKTVIQEAAALTALTLFVGMIAIWSQVLGNL